MTIMVLDDEFYVREKINKILQWSALDITKIIMYNNGEKALEKLQEENPDIILVDINMPRLNGLDFIKIARDIIPKSKFLIISGYDSFEYVQKAIKYGVKDYILKPIEAKELCKLIQGLILDIKNENIKNNLFEQRGKQAKMYFLKLLLFEKSEAENTYIKESLNDFNCNLCNCKELTVCTGLIDNREDLSIKEINNANNKTLITIDTIFTESEYEICFDNERRIIIIFCGTPQELEIKLNQVIHVISHKYNLSYSFGLSSVCNKLDKIYISYKKALKVLLNKIIWEHKVVLKQDYLSTKEFDKFYISKEVKDSLILGVRKKDYSYVELIIDEIYNKLQNLQIRIDFLRVISIHLLEPCMLILEEKKGDSCDEYLSLYLSVYNEAILITDISQLFSYIKKTYKSCCNRNCEDKEKIHPAVKKVMDYISNNYMKSDFAIDDISTMIGINYNYLCTIFKKNLNITINEYINDYRMSKALELINIGDYNISEIAESVGFSNVSYFTRCFKKKFSVSPSKFKIK